ncbi:SH3 domain-containing kinase-binding protein 1-like, partial [Hyposmocoma kahamanoa]|uniref:SH3 domain-containing kinase-binding protein 1-like n=1 Tax=Hyposmocoma kahamanoa TaxID=1477025 RepID=UPI000E6D80EB
CCKCLSQILSLGSCIVNYPYDALEPDELTIRPGDVLHDVERLSGGWWRGELRGRRGMFPDNFVSPLTEGNHSTRSSTGGVQGRCRAVFSYQPANPDELALCVGDVLEVLGEVEEGWWQGRRQGRLGVFPSNFVVMLDPAPPAVPVEPAPALPPKRVKEQCRVLFPYIAVNEDELSLSEGDIVTILSKDAPDRGWWRGELNGRVGLFPDNFVQVIPTTAAQDVEEKKPERPTKTGNSIYPVLNKYTERSQCVKEFTTTKNTEKNTAASMATVTSTGSGSSSSGEWDRLDGALPSKASQPTNTFDHVERNSMLNDPRAGRVKAPRRRPPSQPQRDDVSQQIGLSNGHEAEKPALEKEKEKPEEIKPRTREWEKHKAPWMAELKLNQARKSSFGADGKSHSVTSSSESGIASKTGGGSTDRILDCGLEDKRASHSMEMSRSTSSISNKISVLENFEETTTKVRHSMDPAKETMSDTTNKPAVQSPTAAGRTLTSMLEDIKKPQAPTPPSASARTFSENLEKAPHKVEVTVFTLEPQNDVMKNMFDKGAAVELKDDKPLSAIGEKVNTLERRIHTARNEKGDNNTEVLIAQLNNRILNLEKLLEVQNAKFNAAIEDLTAKLAAEVQKRQALQAQMEKLAHCVTQV